MSKLVDRVLIKEYTTSAHEIAIVASSADAPAVAAALTRAHLKYTIHYGGGSVPGKKEWGEQMVTFHFDPHYYWDPDRLRAALAGEPYVPTPRPGGSRLAG